MGWTQEQKQAIFASGNVIVSAGAGAGKTSVLTERVFRLVQDGLSVDQMLILTFTRAAASEMKARITDRLLAAAEQTEDPALRERWKVQCARLENASISTIHSFCARVLSRHFYRVGLTPSAKTMDETESKVLSASVLERVLTETAAEHKEDYRTLIRAFHGEESLIDAVKKLSSFLEAQAEPKAWLDGAVRSVSDPQSFDRLLALELEDDQAELAAHLEELRAAREELPPACEQAIGLLDDLLTHGRGALLMTTGERYGAALRSFPSGNLSFPKDFAMEDREDAKEAKSALGKLVKAQSTRYAASLQELLAAEQEGAAVIAALCGLTDRYLSAYAEEKRKNNAMDFSDLEHMTLEILRDEQIAREYRDRFKTIIVDEYQDSNRVQEAILSRIAADGVLFYVGDVKQSIYGFRLAEPKLFLEKCRDFHGAHGTRIDLSRNFRSGKAVIDTVNRVFSVIMRRGIAGIDYDDKAKLVQGSRGADGTAQLHLFERRLEVTEDNEDHADILDAEAEACFAAHTILDSMEHRRYFDPKRDTERPFRYDDFAILLRDKAQAGTWARVLAQAGIPCYADLSGGYFESMEVQLLLQILKILDNRRQDIPMMAVLRSFVGGFTDTELIALRAEDKKVLWSDVLTKVRDTDGKVDAFLSRLEQWNRLAKRLPMEELLYRILDDTRFAERMAALPGGRQRTLNIESLLSKARTFDTVGGGVHAFLRRMEDVQKSTESAAAQTVTANVVRIMTVHKSKGLEFPVVFYGGLGKRFNRQSEREALQLHAERGIGLRYVDALGCKRNMHSMKIVKRAVAEESFREELRVLYVGMTRARTELYLLGCINDAEAAVRTLPMPTSLRIRKAGTPIRLLMLALNGTLPMQLHSKTEAEALFHRTGRIPIPVSDAAEQERLRLRLGWRYPYPEAGDLPDKTSVTAQTEQELTFDPPAFLSETDGRTVGTKVHTLLQRLPNTALSEEEFLTLCRRIPNLPSRQIAAVRAFLQRPLYLRLLSSPTVHREWSFVCPVEAGRIFPTDSQEKVLLQGVIDACFSEEDGWVLLDYKTDRVEGDPVLHAERHRRQVELYAHVLETLTHRKVKEAYVVLLSAQTDVRIL